MKGRLWIETVVADVNKLKLVESRQNWNSPSQPIVGRTKLKQPFGAICDDVVQSRGDWTGQLIVANKQDL